MTESSIIRQALDSDVAAVTACAEVAYVMYVERIGKPPAPMVADFATQISENKVHVLEQRQQLIGFTVSFPRLETDPQSTREAPDSVYFLENIAINPNQQGKGLGKLLIDHVIAMATQSNCGSVELYTNELMVENIAWYHKLGFTEVGRKHEDGFSRVYMKLQLKS